MRGERERERVQQRKLISSSRDITVPLVGKVFLFLRDLDRKDDSCAITLDFLRVPPFPSISSALLPFLSPRPLIPSLPSYALPLFSPGEFNSCRRRERGRTLNLPRRRLGHSARISISMLATPESIRSPPFNNTRSRARHFCPTPDTSLRVIRTADREASPYQSLPLDRTCCGRKSRIIIGTRR